jgi:hypothetical protein
METRFVASNTDGQQSAAKGSSTTVSRYDFRPIQHFDSSAQGLVRRWRLDWPFPCPIPPLPALSVAWLWEQAERRRSQSQPAHLPPKTPQRRKAVNGEADDARPGGFTARTPRADSSSAKAGKVSQGKISGSKGLTRVGSCAAVALWMSAVGRGLGE